MTDKTIADFKLEDAIVGDGFIVLKNLNDKTKPLGFAIFDKDESIIAYVTFDLHTANTFGERFCELYNETLIKIRGDT